MFQITITANSDGPDNIVLLIHDQDHYLPGCTFLFGTECVFLSGAFDVGIGMEYHLLLTETHHRATRDNPCEESPSANGNLHKCVINAIQEKMGCKIKSLSSGDSRLPHLPQCQTRHQIEDYVSAIRSLETHSAKSLYNSTGCKANCLQKAWQPVFKGN